jgi:hypothetical protein
MRDQGFPETTSAQQFENPAISQFSYDHPLDCYVGSPNYVERL